VTTRERFLAVLNGKTPDDRMPMIEWAAWWDKTYQRWESEGLPKGMDKQASFMHFGLDDQVQVWINPYKGEYYEKYAGKPIESLEFYLEMRETLYPKDCVEWYVDAIMAGKKLQEEQTGVFWITLQGFFWFPRTLFGIEDHLYAFYDYPEIMHAMNKDLADFNDAVIEGVCKYATPDFMTFAEDMSYNLGPMLSEELFDEFLLPYYKQTIPTLEKHGIIPICDTDGMLEPMIPWLKRAGLKGALPLERQAGVDVNRIRAEHPDFILLGGYDKMVMSKGEAEMRAEFERILPCWKAGYYIPSVDHQTPPEVSLENYQIYLKLFEEYAKKAVE